MDDNGKSVVGVHRTVYLVLNTTMSAGVSDPFESLPYYDDDLQKYPYLEALVDKELAREVKAPQTLHPSIPPLADPFAVSEHIGIRLLLCERSHDDLIEKSSP